MPAIGTFPIGTEPIGGLAPEAGIDPTSVVDLDSVGHIYEVGINGRGYMLADTPEGPSYKRSRAVLQPPRFITENTPFNDTFERYFHTAQSDWTGGAGQDFVDRPTSSETAFLDAQGVDPFKPGKLSLLHATASAIASAYTNLAAAVAGDDIYLLTGAKQLTYRTPGGVNTAFTVAAATTIEDLASDGQRWYAAAGAQGLFRGTTSDPGAAWSAIAGNVVWWAGQRACVAYKSGGSSTPNTFSTLTDVGAEEVASGRLILPAGWTITKGAGGSGHVFFGAFSGDQGVVYRWQVGTADTPSVALELPRGLIPREVFWYQGQVMVRCERPLTSGGSQAVLFRCPVGSDGTLTPFVVATLGDSDTTVDHGPGTWAATERLVLFSWSSMDGSVSGVGALDLAFGGYTKWLQAPAGAGRVRAIAIWQGRAAFSIDGTGLVYEQTTYRTSGWIRGSISDKASSLSKVYDSVTVGCEPLADDETVRVALSFDGGDSYQPYPALDLVKRTRQTTDIGRTAVSVGYEVTLTGDGTTTPTLMLVQVRQHAVGIADTIVQVPIDCGDQVHGLPGTELAENGPGVGSVRAAYLESLVGQRVKYQDVDYAQTGRSEVLEVVSAERTSLGVFDRFVGRNALRQIMVLTLRAGAE